MSYTCRTSVCFSNTICPFYTFVLFVPLTAGVSVTPGGEKAEPCHGQRPGQSRAEAGVRKDRERRGAGKGSDGSGDEMNQMRWQKAGERCGGRHSAGKSEWKI